MVEALLKLLSDSGSAVRQKVSQALEQLASGEPRIVHALLKAIANDFYRSPRQAAVDALVALPIDRAAVSQQIEEMLQGYEPICSKQIDVDGVVDSLLDAFLKIVG